MPIYEYACASCGHHLEVMQSIKDPPLTQCPKCKKKKLQKLVSAAGFQLKGTGWYVTDFRDKGKPAADKKKDGEEGAAADKSAESKEPSAKPEAATDSAKPAGKAEKKKKKKSGGDGA
jgi:putative FmdB family regulatory protein